MIINKYKIGDTVYIADSSKPHKVTNITNGLYKVTCDIEDKDGTKNKTRSITRSVTEAVLNSSPKTIKQPVVQSKPGYYKKYEILDIDTTVSLMYEYYKDGKLILDPEYQREFVWTDEQKRSYITNLLRYKAKIEPTIAMYVDNNDNIIYEVIDGKQRLTTIFDFIEGKFPLYDGRYIGDLAYDDTMYIMKHNIHYTRITSRDNSFEVAYKDRLEIFLEINNYGTKMDKSTIDRVERLYNSL